MREAQAIADAQNGVICVAPDLRHLDGLAWQGYVTNHGTNRPRRIAPPEHLPPKYISLKSAQRGQWKASPMHHIQHTGKEDQEDEVAKNGFAPHVRVWHVSPFYIIEVGLRGTRRQANVAAP
jgi:hypothetical protein